MNMQATVLARSANEVFLRRARKVIVRNDGGVPASASYIATFLKNLESLGYAGSHELVEAVRKLPLGPLAMLHEEVIGTLTRGVGGHRVMTPMYVNFPVGVMDMNDAALYLNALLHYWTNGEYLPDIPKEARNKLTEPTKLTLINLGSQQEFEQIFVRLASSNSSLSPNDLDDLRWFIAEYRDGIFDLMPPKIPHREVRAVICAALMQHTDRGEEKANEWCDTATDVLRVAVALSGGDVSLAEPCKFSRINRSNRKLLLQILDGQKNAVEDMLRWKKRWIRLGERLHPGEFKARFKHAHKAFDILRNDSPFETFNGKIERALEQKDIDTALSMISLRAGDFARRLDHLIRISSKEDRERVIAEFRGVSNKVSTPVLLQVLNHFEGRDSRSDIRVFFPKGQLAKAQAIPNTLPALRSTITRQVAQECANTLVERFSKLPKLGRCYIDPELKNFMVPFSQRSASKSLRTASRGSRMPLPVDKDTLRFFVWWKNGRYRTDLDLSAVMFDKNFTYISAVTFYNLKDFGGCHSGDIVDAPYGASEFIDISRKRCLEKGVRYVVMSINSFTQQPYCDLPECFAGWMSREKPESGEIYEPKTVEDKLDISANSVIAIPAIFDLEDRKVIWADLSLSQWPFWYNTVAANLWGIQLTLKSLVQMRKSNIYDLLSLHVRARGELCSNPEEADIVFDVAGGTPFDLARIAAEFMAT